MKHILIIFISLILIGCSQGQQKPPTTSAPTPVPSPTPSPSPFSWYIAPEVEPQEVYLVAMLGDSMTEALGPHGGPMTEQLNQLYDQYQKDILVDNYAVGSSNITSIDKRLTQQTQVREWTFEPILERDELDLILIESFAYNPLSDITNREEALREQDRYLTDLMTQLRRNLPDTRIAFVATIAPNRLNFAQSSQNLTDDQSTTQANERIEYLENHIKYATDHNIPLINIYQQSLSESGDGQTALINPDDSIHPSATGINLISTTIAEFVHQQEILPY